jgi:hypothetical protein
MPNWCSNNVTFTGNEDNLNNFQKVLEKTIEIQDSHGNGEMLFVLEGVIDGYMFWIQTTDTGVISFESRWSPIPQDMVRIAQLFDLEFEYEYEESGGNLYGKYIYKNGVLTDQYLDEDDIETCKIHKEDDEFPDMDYEKLWDLVENMDKETVNLHSSLKQHNEKNLCN